MHLCSVSALRSALQYVLRCALPCALLCALRCFTHKVRAYSGAQPNFGLQP